MDRDLFLALAFIQLVGMKEHPRNSSGADLEACFDLACEMWEVLCQRGLAEF